MELDVGIFLHRHLQSVGRLGQEHVAAILVFGEIQSLTHLEISQLLLVFAGNPCGLVERNGLVATRGVILMQQTVLDHLKLKFTHRSNDFPSGHLTRKELGHTLVRQLFQALGQLLRFHRVCVLHITELFGREARDAFIVQDFAFGQRVANLEIAGIVKAHDVARIGFVKDRFLLCHECRRVRELQLATLAHVEIVLVALEATRHHAHKSDAVTVIGVHIGVDLEDETRKLLFRRLDAAFHCIATDGRRRNLDEAVQQFLHAEIVQSRAEKHGADVTF